MPTSLTSHRSHDYRWLMRRWRGVVKKCNLSLTAFSSQDALPIYLIQTRKAKAGKPFIYLSTGVHGDEPAGTEGVITWAEENLQILQEGNFTIFPCINPWGLINNSRYTSRGHDLNRQFHNSRLATIRAYQKILADHRFDLALNLHEDYDAQGVYLYELNARKVPISPDILQRVKSILPIDPRRKIDGRKMTHPGYFHRSLHDKKLPDGPEAIYLARNHANLCFTVETPSEFALDLRIRAQVLIVQTLLQRVFSRTDS